MLEDAASGDLPDIPGVRPAEQARSRELQDRFVEAGRALLREQRLSEISVPDLAKKAASSVGGFYSRFETKEALFEFLRAQMLIENGRLHDESFDAARASGASATQICEAFVDTMIRVFSGPWRGVLREAYASIPEKQGSWVPMNTRGQSLRDRLSDLLLPVLPPQPDVRERVAFAVQSLFGVLNNELMNPHLMFTSDDPRFRAYLVESFCHMVGAQRTQTP
ncbi:MAG: helix-turn-helix transcriptional regulator [Rhodobacter sp.]|nr:helix-turn-helix transcriptional regulator [Paracoccaceae bacterium]MCC0076348.1 helix-turn-helix transcriptional regulator [Rhodobacter sp.]